MNFLIPDDMPNKKPTDNDIVKALECCADWCGATSCRDCPLENTRCIHFDKLKETLDLINRQKEELEMNDAEIKELQIALQGYLDDVAKARNLYKQSVEELNQAKAEIERLKKSNRNWRRKVQMLKADNNELIYKLECLLCHSTGGKLSKHTYPLGTMESYVNDTIQEYCEEAEKEAKAEAYKEFAERLKERKYLDNNGWSHGEHPYVVEVDDIDDVLEELVGDENDD